MSTFASSLWRDMLLAGRALAKARGFTLICVISLGIGIVPVIAVPYWSRLFTTPPRGIDADGLVELVTVATGPRRASELWSYPDFIDLRDADTGVSMIGWAMGQSRLSVSAAEAATPTAAMWISEDYFQTLGVSLNQGAGFGPGPAPSVIVGYRLWQDRLRGDAGVIGTTLVLDGTPHTIVGIAPEDFEGHLAFREADLFLPLERHPRLAVDDDARNDRATEWLRIHGRLAPGVGIAQATAAIEAATAQLAVDYPVTNELRSGAVEPYQSIGSLEARDLSIILSVWQAMALVPLIVVCLNISGMALVRNATRERELAVRQAIGATRARLVQHLLAEAVVLAALGGLLGAVVLFNVPPFMSWLLDEPIPPRWQDALRPDLSMMAIVAGACLATSLVFGWLPAIRFSRPVINTVLKDEAGTGGVRTGRLHRVTAALQIAIAVPLLVLSGVSLDRMRTTATSDLGFDADRLYAAVLPLDAIEGDAMDVRVRGVRDAVADAAGVEAVTIADGLPLDFRGRRGRISLLEDEDAAPTTLFVQVTRVDERFLPALNIPLERGRNFTGDDAAGSTQVTIISSALADVLFPDQDPSVALGRALSFGWPDENGDRLPTLTIVGVTPDFPTSQMSTERPQLLLPFAQHPDVVADAVPTYDDRGGGPHVMVVARARVGEPEEGLTTLLENAVRELDPEVDRADIVTGAGLRRYSVSDFLTQSAVSGTGGGVILGLTALGLYGVVGMMVATRTREIAVRVTLGATRARVIRMIVLDVVSLVSPGLVVGLLIAAVLVHVNGGILGVALSRLEPLAFVAGAAVALLVAMLASLPPARRAASVEPMVAMRST